MLDADLIQPLHPLNMGPSFRVPDELAVTKTLIQRALVVGSCFSEGISHHIHRVFDSAKSDHITYNFAGELPDQPPSPIGDYAFQLIVLPLRTIMPEFMFMRLRWDDRASFEQCLAHSEQTLLQLLDGALAYHQRHGLTTFVTNFLCPQTNSHGRLLHYNDPRNPAWYVRRLNDVLADYCARHQGIYVVNLDEIASGIGRRHLQDDLIITNSHGVFVTDWDWQFDQSRLHPPPRLHDTHHLRCDELVLSLWREIEAMYRTIRQIDSVKIVICDLDDTLWRGVVAEDGVDSPALIEGWPLGIIEALTYVKRRGVLLAIASKNDEARIRELWPQTVGNRLPLEDFAIVKINWEPKSSNVQAILQEANLLPRSALFIDDNPVERQNVVDANPGIRVLGSDLYSIRRILMWAPEIQVASVSEESARRTEMIQAQVERERSREALPRDEFLASLNVALTRISISDVEHARFARALELINKSNQFNTTGKRWSMEEALELFSRGGKFEAFEVADKYTQYGLVGVAIVDGSSIIQYVMSCRVLGLDVELAFIHLLANEIVGQAGIVTGRIMETDANVLCRNLYAKAGFAGGTDGLWAGQSESFGIAPAHVQIADPLRA